MGKNILSPGGYLPVPDDIERYLENGYLRFPLYENLVGNGAVRASVADLSRFMIAHMNDGRAPNGYQLLQPETVEMMHGIAVPTSGSINLIPTIGYGLGWTIAEGGIQGHIGGASGYEADDYVPDFGGTSAACPYAAGAVAALQSAAKDILGGFLSPAQVKSILLSTGDNITDGKVAITKPRVNLGVAIDSLGCTGEILFIHNTSTSSFLVVDTIDAPAWVTLNPTPPYSISPLNNQLVLVTNF